MPRPPAAPWSTALWRTTLIEGRLYLRDPAGVFFTLAFPVIILAVTSGGRNEALAEYGGAGRTDLQVAGYLGMILATMAIMGIPEQLAQYREWGVLRRLRATPLRPGTVIGAQVVLAAVVTAAGGAILVLTGFLGFGLDLVHQARRPPPEALTAREVEVLQLVAGGATNRDAGRALHVSEATVKSHLLHAFAKLGVDDRTAAVTTALQRGLIHL